MSRQKPTRQKEGVVSRFSQRWLALLLLALAGFTAARVGAVDCSPPPTNLIGWWPGDGSATNIAGTNHGILQGGASASAAGFVGNAFTFDGTNAYVQITNSAVLQPSNLTVEAWVRFSGLDSAGSGAAAGVQYVVFKPNTRNNSFEGFDLGKTRVGGTDPFRFTVSSASGQSVVLLSSTLVSTGQWYHVAAVRGSNFVQLYVNGALERQANVTFPQNYGNLPLYFGTSGRPTFDRKFKGNLDEVTLYNRTLSSNEIAAVFAAGAAGKCKAPDITAQPQSKTVFPGSNATFTVTATGVGTLNYQWRFNAANLAGGTNSSLTITNVSAANTGNYQVVISSVAGSVTSSVAVLKLAGFTEVLAGVFTNAWFGHVSWVDYDNDGDLDLFVSGYDQNQTPTSWLYRNDGNGTFTPVPTSIPNWERPSADWGDFDNDGDMDLVYKGSLSFNGPVAARVYRNDGNGQFTFLTSIGAYFDQGSITWADVDSDGRLDVLQSDFNGTFIGHNNGDGTFPNVAQFLGTRDKQAATVTDFDNDGLPDLFLVGDFATRLYRNLGANTFTNLGLALPQFYTGGAAWSDYNNDGFADVLLCGDGWTPAGTLTRLYRNDAAALTHFSVPFPAVYNGVMAWGDFDNDGKSDLFLAGYTGYPTYTYLTKIFRNLGGDNFADFGTTLPGLNNASACWADYDNDGFLDFAFMGGWASDAKTKLYRGSFPSSNSPPTAPGGLTVTRGPNSALLTWNAATDNEQTGGLSYNIHIGTSPNGVNILSPMADLATGFRRIAKTGNAGHRQSFLITSLPAGNYYWSVQAIDNGFKGSVFAAEQSFNLPAPVITDQPQPQSLTVLAGAQVSWTVGATGAAPLSYQWQLNGTNLPGDTNAALVLNEVQTADAGIYSVVVSNAFGSMTSSNAVLLVNTPPRILAQPESASVIEGSNVTFSVLASGDAPLSYQWLFSGATIANATNTSLKLSPVLPSHAGNYSVQITNLSGVTNSAIAVLSVPPSAPVIVAQPQGLFVPPDMGVDAVFAVSAIGTTPFTYQWFLDGTIIPGATTASFVVTNVQTTNAGNYSVVISNSAGFAFSADAALSVTVLPSSVLHTIPMTYLSDFVYDRPRDILYIATGYADVQRFHLGSNIFLPPISIVGTLTSLDLSPDGNSLVVGDRSYGGTNSWIWLADLQSNTVRQVLFDRPAAEGGIYSVAFGNDGAVVCTAQYTTSATSSVRLRRYDPATDTTTVPNPVERDSPLTASADGSFIASVDTQTSFGVVSIYNVTSKGIWGSVRAANYVSAPAGVSRDGTQIAQLSGGSLLVFTNRGTIFWDPESYLTTIGPGPNAVVYHPLQDLMFLGWGGYPEIRVYNTTTFTETAAFNFGSTLASARLRMSRDGSRIFGQIPGAIRWVDWTNIAPVIDSFIGGGAVHAGSNAVFATHVFGSPRMRYQWRRDGVSLPDATNATLVVSNLSFPSPDTHYQLIAYNPYGVAMSGSAAIIVVSRPIITNQPASQTFPAGSNVTLSVSAGGNTPLSYQWRFNGANIPGVTTSSITYSNAQSGVVGDYSVVVANAYGSVTSAVATLTVNPSAPYFLTQPASQGAPVGANVLFTAIAHGTDPITYQWQFNGVDLPGKTDTTLSLPNAQTTNSGNYTLTASNSVGVTPSMTVSLVVTSIPPTITSQPRGFSIPAGLPVSLSAAASGTAPLRYQWTLNGGPVSNATNFTLNLSNLLAGDFGNYQLVVTNDGGAITSAIAQVTPGNVATWGFFSANAKEPIWPPPGLSNVTAISAGSSYSMALRSDGTVALWGSVSGVSASGPITSYPTSHLYGIVAIAAGQNHALALRSNGTVIAWGSNSSGQTNVPTTLSNVVSIAAGSAHSAALRSDGTVIAWGGNPTDAQTSIPPGLIKVVAIDAGGFQTLALRQDGILVGWGGRTPIPVPPDVKDVIGFSTAPITSVGMEMALMSNGLVRAWGVSGSATNVPASVTNVIAVEAAGGFDQGTGVGLALRSNRTVIAWGSTIYGLTNVPPGLSNVVTLSAGTSHALALVDDGRPLITRPPIGGTFFTGQELVLKAKAIGTAPLSFQWFKNSSPIPLATNESLLLPIAQFGDAGSYQLVVSNALGVAQSVPVPVVISNLPPVIMSQPVARYAYHGSRFSVGASVIGSSPLQLTWWQNASPIASNKDELVFDRALPPHGGNYQLVASNSFGSVTSSIARITFTRLAVWGTGVSLTNAPVDLGAVRDVGSGYYHLLAINANGTVAAWGTTLNGATNVPPGLNNVIAVTGGKYFSVALRSNGTAVAWGMNNNGQTNVPISATNLVAIAAGGDHALGLRANGTVVGWGYNGNGQLNFPSGLSNVVAISGGQWHSAALKSDGTAVTWGLGAVNPPNATNLIAIAAGFSQTFGLRSDGTVLTWMNGNQTVPTNLANVVAIASGGASPQNFGHTFALKADGTTVGWGNNFAGQMNVPNELVSITKLFCGYTHTVAFLNDRSPAVTTQPWDQRATPGANVTLAAPAAGRPALSYQWRLNGTHLPGATNPTLTLPAVNRGSNGAYSAFISNSLGTATSRSAQLDVGGSLKLLSATVGADGALNFAVVDSSGAALSAGDVPWIEVLASSNLVDWETLSGALTFTNGTLLLQDPSSTNFPTRFYRMLEH